MKQTTVLLFTSLVLCSLLLPAQEVVTSQDYANRPIHTIGFHYNNCIYPKGKFSHYDTPDRGWDGITSYGNEFILKYNLTFHSGWGFTLEGLKGTRSFNTYDRADNSNNRDFEFVSSLLPFDHHYWGFNIKASYSRNITSWLTIQPEIGIKTAHLVTYGYVRRAYKVESMEDNGVLVGVMEFNNDNCPSEFVPDLATGINFFFHPKNDPRHNFVLGFNMNLGFVTRYKGFYSLNAPEFTKPDCDISFGSTYFGFNLGYEFHSFPKPLYKTKAFRKKREYHQFDNTQPIHTFGFYLSNGESIEQHTFKGNKGGLMPTVKGSYVPELVLKYSCAIKKGWGITAEIPIGLFSREYFTEPFDGRIPTDTVWANGVVGVGIPYVFGFKTPYIGLSLKASYLAAIHKNVFIQPEVGIKLMPFLFSPKHWYIDEKSGEQLIMGENEMFELVFMHCDPVISASSYFVPDVTFALNFMVHGKKLQNNFVFGFNINVGFVDRIHFVYQTTDVLPAYAQSSGEFGFRMSSVGFHIGYLFMNGKKQIFEKIR